MGGGAKSRGHGGETWARLRGTDIFLCVSLCPPSPPSLLLLLTSPGCARRIDLQSGACSQKRKRGAERESKNVAPLVKTAINRRFTAGGLEFLRGRLLWKAGRMLCHAPCDERRKAPPVKLVVASLPGMLSVFKSTRGAAESRRR